MEKAVLYVRVSSKEQKEEGYSIPSQKKLIRKYAKDKGLKIVEEYEEVETAKMAGRTAFGKMVKLLKNNKDIANILVEKTDRLYRNYHDLVKIDDLGRTIHFVKENLIISKDSKSYEKLNHDLKVLLAKNYTDNLSEETSKGMLEKAEQGLYPSFAPQGYINNKETGGIDIDFKRAPVIKDMIELYATGRASMRDLKEFADKRDYRTRKGSRINLATLGKMLDNPIYIGDFIWKGKYYEGKHDPIVSREIFEKVQRIKSSKNKPRKHTRDFAFRGLLKCGHCGCLITAEIKKERYVYYKCTKSRGNCPEKPIREELLAELLGEPLKRLRMSPERVEWIKGMLKESNEEKNAFHEKEMKRLKDEYEKAEDKISRLYDDRLDGTVDKEFWKIKYNELKSKLVRIKRSIEEHERGNFNYLESGVRILELAERAYSLYVRNNHFKKRRLLDMVSSNYVLKDDKVHMEFKEVFAKLIDGIEEEEKLTKQKAPKSDIDKNWLPR